MIGDERDEEGDGAGLTHVSYEAADTAAAAASAVAVDDSASLMVAQCRIVSTLVLHYRDSNKTRGKKQEQKHNSVILSPSIYLHEYTYICRAMPCESVTALISAAMTRL